jgi:hypothetical protein
MDDSPPLLTDDAWAKVEAELARLKSRRAAPPELPDRDFVEAVLYLARGTWAGLLRALPAEGLEAVAEPFVDSTVIRAHPHAAEAPKKKGCGGAGARPQPGRVQHQAACTRPRWTSGRRSRSS